MHSLKAGNERMIACFLVSSEADLTHYKHCRPADGIRARTHAHRVFLSFVINVDCEVNTGLNEKCVRMCVVFLFCFLSVWDENGRKKEKLPSNKL